MTAAELAELQTAADRLVPGSEVRIDTAGNVGLWKSGTMQFIDWLGKSKRGKVELIARLQVLATRYRG